MGSNQPPVRQDTPEDIYGAAGAPSYADVPLRDHRFINSSMADFSYTYGSSANSYGSSSQRAPNHTQMYPSYGDGIMRIVPNNFNGDPVEVKGNSKVESTLKEVSKERMSRKIDSILTKASEDKEDG